MTDEQQNIPVVTPGTESSQAAPGAPPSDAVLLFNGKDLEGWIRTGGGPARWKIVEDGVLQVEGGDIQTVQEFGDIQLHIEFASPAIVQGEGQGRGNSGIFLMDRYEIQVLDCYENPTYADGMTGAVYNQYPPLVNACRKPGEWQSFDIFWTTPLFDGDQLVHPAYMTVVMNGVLLQNHVEVLGTTKFKPAKHEPHGPTGPIRLQDHGHPVLFRNIWCRPIAR